MCLPALPAIAASLAASISSASAATLMSAASLAVGVAGAGAGYVQQRNQAKLTNRAIEDNYSQQTEVLKTQYSQTNRQAADEMSVRARESQMEQARLRVIGGESGLAGGSNDRILNEGLFNFGTDIASIESGRQNTLRQLKEEGKAVRAGNQSQVNQIKRPSLIGTGLQIAGAAVDSGTTYQYLDGKLKTSKGNPK